MADSKNTSTKRRRARTEDGQYRADDPSTPNVNEAYVQDEPKVAPRTRKKAEKPSGPVIYESREKEPKMYDVAGINSIRNFTNGHLEWEVAPEDVERFESNHFFTRGRIRRKT